MKFKLILIALLLNFSLASGAEKKVDQNTIHKNLRCLVCQGQSISDSNSDFAQTIKLVVEDLIDEGKTEEEIEFAISNKIFQTYLKIKKKIMTFKCFVINKK